MIAERCGGVERGVEGWRGICRFVEGCCGPDPSNVEDALWAGFSVVRTVRGTITQGKYYPKKYNPNKLRIFPTSRVPGSLSFVPLQARVSCKVWSRTFKELVFHLDEFRNMFVMAVGWSIPQPFVPPCN